MDFDDDDEQGPVGPSRSELKREAEALQRLGEVLIALPPDKLVEIPLDEPLREAIMQARRISARGGHRRQLQLVGKLMRQIDPEPIRAGLEMVESRGKLAVVRQKQAERWRERLLTEGDGAMTEFLQTFPDNDVQSLRQLIRDARREQAAGKPARSARTLFQRIVASLDG